MDQPSFLDRLTFPRLLTAIVFVAIFAMAVRVVVDADTWWHLASGRYIVENRAIPLTDPFSHTRLGTPWAYPAWLAQILLYGLYLLGGWPGLLLGVAALVTLAFVFVYRQSLGNPLVRAFGVILGVITSSGAWAARPQIISFLLTALVAYLLDRYKRHDGKVLLWLPLVMLVWANTHAGFAIAFILMLCYIVGEGVNRLLGHDADNVLSWRQLLNLALATGLCVLAVGVNPNTWQIWFFPFRTVGIGALRDFIQEWQSPDFHQIWQQPFIVLLLLTVLALARSGRRADFTDLALLATWTTGALLAGRNISIFALVAVPIFVRHGTSALTGQLETLRNVGWAQRWLQTLGQPLPEKRALAAVNWLLLALVVAAALVKIYLPLAPGVVDKATRSWLPVDAVAYIQANRPAGPLFNSYNWGGYLIFELWPDYPVYIDGRTDLYDDAFIRRYLNVVAANDGWQQTLDDDAINLVLIENNSILDKFLRISPTWREVHRDTVAAVYSRKTALP